MLPTAMESTAALVNTIQTLLEQGTHPNTIGVQYASTASKDLLLASFTGAGIPCYCQYTLPLLHQPLIHQLLQVLQYIRAEQHLPGSGEALLFEVLHFPWWGIPANEPAMACMELFELRIKGSDATLLQYLHSKTKEQPTDLFWQAPAPGMAKALAALESLVAAAAQTPLPQLAHLVMERYDFDEHLQHHPQKVLQEQLVQAFIQHLKSTGTNDLETGMQQLENIQRTTGLPAAIQSGDPNGIQLLPSPMPEGRPFAYLFEIANTARTASLPQTVKKPEIPHLDDAYEARALRSFRMNVSALNTYLHCPLAFYYHNVVRIPSPRNEAMAFGSAVHHALEQLLKQAQQAEELPDAEVLLSAFMDFMQDNRALFTPAEWQRRTTYGMTMLEDYYHQRAIHWNLVAAVERNIRGVEIDEIPLKGKLDKIEFDGKKATIVDYKSGNVERALRQLQPPSEALPNGGDYWRQAVFYKLLVDNLTTRDWQVQGVVFDFIEPDAQGQYRQQSVTISAADEATVREQIRTVWHKVQRHDFYTGCGKEGCYWCGFVKRNELTIKWHQQAEEQAG
ncbi:PD-(D/E)XK nuclease family protein [Cnuella takakiae]|nr:PD-(D/E)XK nuclease family protein [Cnuella takakiae]